MSFPITFGWTCTHDAAIVIDVLAFGNFTQLAVERGVVDAQSGVRCHLQLNFLEDDLLQHMLAQHRLGGQPLTLGRIAAEARKERARREIETVDELCRIATTGLVHGRLTLAGTTPPPSSR